MATTAALKVALELLHMPTQVARVRAEPLPEGLLILLRIASGDQAAIADAARAVGRHRDQIREAAVFFIEQIMFAPAADSYRVLGATPHASREELQRNMKLLLKWLHPDAQRAGAHAVFVRRVTAAWSDVKTPQRRAAYAVQEPWPAPNASRAARRRRRPQRLLATPPGAQRGSQQLLAVTDFRRGRIARFILFVRRLMVDFRI